MTQVFEINRQRVFTHRDACKLLPVVFTITEKCQVRVQALIGLLDSVEGKNDKFVQSIEKQINDVVTQWQVKLQKLGLHAKGLWVADFDCGNGFYCWKYPETDIKYWHGYSDGFSKRVPVKQQGSGAEIPCESL